jgi:O-antigen/teichoic acid export membrane protein
MSELFQDKSQKLLHVFEDAMWYLALLAVPITFGIASTADVFIPILFPEYFPSIQALQILAFVLLALFLDYPIGSLLNAAGKASVKTAIMGLTVVVSMTANFFLIQKLGILGASLSSVIALFFMFFAGLSFVKTILPAFLFRTMASRLLPILLSGLLMSLVVFLLKSILPIVFLIFLGAMAYLCFLFLFRVLRKEHLSHIRKLFYAETDASSHL